ncbi:MAG: glucose 1-dehydrogenase [Mesorhizobium sp.]
MTAHQPAGRVTGKVAIITGGASGIGEATCQLFAREGAKVVVADLSVERAEAVAQGIVKAGGDALAWQTNVAEESSVKALVEAAHSRFGRIDVLVNSAGVALPKIDLETSVEEWDRVMSINVRGTFLTTKYVVPIMRDAGGGAIVNLASVAGNVGWAGLGCYSASKGAVRAFTRASAVAHAADRIRINCVNPGITRTAINEELFQQDLQRFRTPPPVGRFGKPMDIAHCCLFLASDEAGFVHGTELIADGGAIA